MVDAAGTKVWSSWPPTLTLQDAAPSLLGPILGFLLRVRGVLCLHAAGVASGQNGFALVGPQGAGKSTLAAAFAEAGYAVLADDVLSVVESAGGFHIQPGYPRLRLWDESVSALYGHSDALPLLAPHWDKRYLDLTGPRHRFHAVSVPLRAIYVLEARSVSPAAPLVEPVSHGAAFMSLVRNTYANQLLDDSMRRTEFSQLESLVAAVPVRRVRPHNDYAQLASLRIAICEDLERIIGDAQGGGS
ncbi:MAG TPA: hypothetical protein VK548_09285 [Candidatus Acidoferrum sp.]|nr:hypothetical protein [Candidatus Acidoferrum sp.]